MLRKYYYVNVSPRYKNDVDKEDKKDVTFKISETKPHKVKTASNKKAFNLYDTLFDGTFMELIILNKSCPNVLT